MKCATGKPISHTYPQTFSRPLNQMTRGIPQAGRIDDINKITSMRRKPLESEITLKARLYIEKRQKHFVLKAKKSSTSLLQKDEKHLFVMYNMPQVICVPLTLQNAYHGQLKSRAQARAHTARKKEGLPKLDIHCLRSSWADHSQQDVISINAWTAK